MMQIGIHTYADDYYIHKVSDSQIKILFGDKYKLVDYWYKNLDEDKISFYDDGDINGNIILRTKDIRLITFKEGEEDAKTNNC